MDLLSTDQRAIIMPIIKNTSSTKAGLRAMSDHELKEAVRTFRELWQMANEIREARSTTQVERSTAIGSGSVTVH